MTDHDHGPAGDGAPAGGPPLPTSEREHYTLAPLDWLAGCSDVGLRHETNQDALALAGRDTEHGQAAVVVISDGVSTSLGSELSAAAAADVASSALVSLLRRLPEPPVEQVEATMVDAFLAAHDAVMSTPGPGTEPGSCTLIAALVAHDRITVGNVGDCRAYWIGDDQQASVLSVDDSVAQARIEMGMSREEAENGFQAHAITRWLGPGTGDVTPRRITLEQPGAGWLLVCSDGLWNYCSPPEQMRALVLEATAQCGDDPRAAAEMLVGWANAQGGRDNTTVALVRVRAGQPRPLPGDGLPAEGLPGDGGHGSQESRDGQPDSRPTDDPDEGDTTDQVADGGQPGA